MAFVLPIGTNIKLQRVPIVTWFLIGLNGLVYFIELVVFATGGQEAIQRLFHTLGFVPAEPRWYALFTSMFVHAAPLPFHLLGNMIYLWLFGRHVEDALGHAVYALFYLGSQMGAILLQTLVAKLLPIVAWNVPQVGASGAIAALLGLFTIRFYHARIKLFYFYTLIWNSRWGTFEIPALIALALWLCAQLIGGVLAYMNPAGSTVAYWAHVGGYLFGMLVAFLFGATQEARGEQLWLRAECALQSEQYERALRYLRQLLQHQPRDLRAQMALVECYIKLGDADAVVQSLRVALQLAMELRLLGAFVDAYTRWHDALDGRITDATLTLDIAAALERSGKYEHALQLLTGVLRTDASAELQAKALARIAEIAWRRLGDGDQAITALRQLIAEFPCSEWTAYAHQMLQRIHENSKASEGRKMRPTVRRDL